MQSLSNDPDTHPWTTSFDPMVSLMLISWDMMFHYSKYSGQRPKFSPKQHLFEMRTGHCTSRAEVCFLPTEYIHIS